MLVAVFHLHRLNSTALSTTAASQCCVTRYFQRHISTPPQTSQLKDTSWKLALPLWDATTWQPGMGSEPCQLQLQTVTPGWHQSMAPTKPCASVSFRNSLCQGEGKGMALVFLHCRSRSGLPNRVVEGEWGAKKMHHRHKQLCGTALPSTADGMQPLHKDNSPLPSVPQAALPGWEA